MAGHDGLTLTDFMPGAEPGEDALARAGAPIDPKTTPVASEDAVVEALRSVHDPEIPVNIYDLGLISGLNISEDGSVDIRVALTARAWPVARMRTTRVRSEGRRVRKEVGTTCGSLWRP